MRLVQSVCLVFETLFFKGLITRVPDHEFVEIFIIVDFVVWPVCVDKRVEFKH